mmetsp:Transcript_6765/g.15371  ORF Transcript_6765/g.15371 Transcript_6765/m.15371 type:complete len:212 (+) Transcript_6765:1852-2487(+)
MSGTPFASNSPSKSVTFATSNCSRMAPIGFSPPIFLEQELPMHQRPSSWNVKVSPLAAVFSYRYRPVVMSRNLGQKMPSALWNRLSMVVLGSMTTGAPPALEQVYLERAHRPPSENSKWKPLSRAFSPQSTFSILTAPSQLFRTWSNFVTSTCALKYSYWMPKPPMRLHSNMYLLEPDSSLKPVSASPGGQRTGLSANKVFQLGQSPLVLS